MSRIAHNDAPQSDPLTRDIYNLIRNQAPFGTLKNRLFGDFNIAARIMTAPGYVQPNGFSTFKLGGIDGDCLLRLHWWPKGMPELESRAGIHDHVFNFTSLVLDGDAPMINRVYDVQQNPGSPLNLYEVDYTGPNNSVIRKLADHSNGVLREQQAVRPGEYYTLPAGVFHSSQIEGDAEALTLIATKLDTNFTRPRFLAPASETDYTRPPLTQAHREQTIYRLNKAF
jgi:hypothetical protein